MAVVEKLTGGWRLSGGRNISTSLALLPFISSRTVQSENLHLINVLYTVVLP